MTLLAEEATWANLQIELEEKLSTWNVPYPEDCAKNFITELRNTGWRTPLPDFHIRNDWRRQRKPTRTEAAQRHIEACREAIRLAAKDE